ncbi:myosin light chain kinase 3-like isoform X2 [Mobula hypostoma]|uniref:myosin light chain kinase 3-like isoform X2 n=1 Tax=Mobula hypostoma TaxID=723540 RepID=UPI002FC2AAC0
MNTPPRKNSKTLVHSLAKVFDSNPIQSQGPPVIMGSFRKCSESSRTISVDSFSAMDIKLESLSQTVDKILGVQENVVQKLNGISQDVVRIGKDIEMLKADKERKKQSTICQGEENKTASTSGEISDLLSTLNQNSKEQNTKIDGIENVLFGMQQVINYLGETFKNSRIAEFILKGQVTSKQRSTVGSDGQKISKKRITSEKVVLRRKKVKVKDHRANEVKGKQAINAKEVKSSPKNKCPEFTVEKLQKSLHTFGDSKVQNLNKENAHSSFEAQHEVKDLAEQNNVTKLKGNTSKEDAGDFELQSSRLAEGIPTAVTPEFPDATLDIYASDETKCEDPVAEEQFELKVVETSDTILNQSSSDRQNDGRTERNNEMHEKIKNVEIQGKIQAEKDSNEYHVKELMKEAVPTGGEDYLIEKENEETGKTHLKAEETNDAEKDTGFESTDSAMTITKESKEKSCAEESGIDQQPVLLHRCGENEREASSLLPAAAEPEGEISDNIEQQKDKDLSTSSKKGTREDLVKDDSKKSRVEKKVCSQESTSEPTLSQDTTTSAAKQQGNNLVVQKTEERGHIVIDDGPAPPAPFEHRIVSTNAAQISNYYTIQKSEVLGGGRFGQVHKCIEKATGLTLAAKIIKTRAAKQKEEVKNEIQVMNQLNHTNLIQLYDAFETKNDIILIMEYIEGGELFDRIIDENYNLTEMDTILFVKQICEGLQYMHQMYILHLDLKPENILCVNREANQVKIIDFGLARRYKPREKLKINFGTPEFLAPEVVNYDFVSFPTDMWSLGVIAYMLLSGLSPFLGEDDNETLNNIIVCKWDLDDEEFENVSEDAKEFISKLLIKEKGARISAAQCLKQPWLNNIAEKAKQCKKNYYAVTAANRLKKLSDSGALGPAEV